MIITYPILACVEGVRGCEIFEAKLAFLCCVFVQSPGQGSGEHPGVHILHVISVLVSREMGTVAGEMSERRLFPKLCLLSLVLLADRHLETWLRQGVETA